MATMTGLHWAAGESCISPLGIFANVLLFHGQRQPWTQILGSSFTFALNPANADSVWRALVIEQVEPALVDLGVMSAARDEQDQFRVYLEADDVFELAPRDLKRSMDEDLPLLVFGPLSAFLATLVTRGRVLVAMVAGVLALAVPLVTSIGFLAQQKEDGREEVRIIAAAAWFVISAGMADLCSACTHALEERKESLRPQVPEWMIIRMLASNMVVPWMLEEATGKGALALRLFRVCCEALAPTTAMGLTLLLMAPGQLDMVAVFAHHTGLGLLVGVPLAALLIPPAVEAGDALATQILSWRHDTEMEMSEALMTLFDNLLPMEFGAKQDWQGEFKFKMRKRTRDFLRLRWLSLAVVLVMTGLFLVYISFSLGASSPSFTADTPRLFEVGHRLYDKARIRGLFDPLEGYQAPMDQHALQSARRCSPTAADAAACTWYKCEAGPRAELQDTEPTECKCYTIQGSETCSGTAARLFGGQATAVMASGLFWNWAGASEAMSGSMPAAGAAAASSNPSDEKGNSLWNILPSFDPQQDDPREYRDKVLFLHGICPRKDRAMLAPRLAMMMKGTAWAQVKQLDTEQLLDPDKGVQVLLTAISKWEEAEEMQLYDKFERALYKTTQRSDETTQSFVNRMSVSFHELGSLTVKDIRAFILLRQSALSVEDKKRVLSMAGNPLKSEEVEKAMRQLSTRVLVGQTDGKRKVYPVNYLEDDAEEVHFTADADGWDEDQAIVYLAEQGDEEAQLTKDFEDQLIEVCQENQDLAMCYNSYAEARAKIRDRLRHRGFWPATGGKGRGKSGKKGGKPDMGRFPKKKESLAERIAASNCRRCGQRGHWKWECPQKEGTKEDVNLAEDTTFSVNDPEILDELPEGLRGSNTIAELYLNMTNQRTSGQQLKWLNQPFRALERATLVTTASKFSMANMKEKAAYASALDLPLPFPEDPEMTYMTAKVEEKVFRPPGVVNLRQWGQMTLAEGKHKGKTFAEVINGDREYASWMKKHPKLSSDWATSFQNYIKAWDQTHLGVQNPRDALKPKASAQPKKMPSPEGWSEEEAELVLIEEGMVPQSSAGKVIKASLPTQGKRQFNKDNKVSMEAEVDPEMVQSLQMQIALLQDQLARITRYCRKGHEHRPILGQAYINGRWQNLSAFAAKYSKGFAKNVAYAIATSKQLGEYPVTLEELLVPCFGVRSAEQQEMAEQIVKRRKYSHKQGPRPGEEEGEVEILGNPEEWKTLSKRRQIRRAKPARVCITIFGDDGAENIPLGKNLAEGDGKSGNVDKSPAMVPSGIVAEPDMDQMKPMEDHLIFSVMHVLNPTKDSRMLDRMDVENPVENPLKARGFVQRLIVGAWQEKLLLRERKGNPDSPVDEKERHALRSLIGALQYAGVHTRPDLCAKIGEVQASVTKATVADLVQCNKILHEAKSHPVSLMVLPIEPKQVTFCAFSDASFLSSKHSTAHQGTLVFTTTAEILENKKAVVAPIAWSSKKVPRVVRSTLSAEAAALSNTVDRLLWLRMLWAWVEDPECEWGSPEEVLGGENKAAVVTDCRSMFDILTRTAVPSCTEHRTTIECLLIRERLKSNCDVRTGRYSLFDEGLVLKQRADGRQRLKWIKEQTPTEEQSDPVLTENEQSAMVSEHFESQDFWKVVPVAFSRNDRAILRRISRAGGSGVNGRLNQVFNVTTPAPESLLEIEVGRMGWLAINVAVS
ncbi:unnamed protein product [Cladocopium goreaui]|uniref:CCHC-type domain-containing protein n=1 Tax=Cladocopium goreaui TaxID=2562237 RepID=A0A9P1G043_9DINO|nr:unnamed protein product [Cladocopium goreaui]